MKKLECSHKENAHAQASSIGDVLFHAIAPSVLNITSDRSITNIILISKSKSDRDEKVYLAQIVQISSLPFLATKIHSLQVQLPRDGF